MNWQLKSDPVEFCTVIDLNGSRAFRVAYSPHFEIVDHVCGPTRIFPSHGSSADARLAQVRPALRWKPLRQIVPLPLAVSLHGVRAVGSSREFARLSVFPWALFRATKSAVKLHALLDLRGNIPTFIHISHGKLGDVKVLDRLIPEPGAFYVMGRAYVDFQRLNVLHSAGAFFVIRAKSITRYRRRYFRPVEKSTGARCDQTIVLTGTHSKKDYPQPLRRVQYRDGKTGKTLKFFDQQFRRPGSDRCRPLHFFAGFEPHLVRENTAICNTFRRRLHRHAKE